MPVTWPVVASLTAISSGRTARVVVYRAAQVIMATVLSAASLEISWVIAARVRDPSGSGDGVVWAAMALSPARNPVASSSRAVCCGARLAGGGDRWRYR